MKPPCLIFEDDHLLVVNKPAGLNTHSPSPFAGEGLYEWLRHREPRWASLAIIHRLDKETSGLILFSKTTLANRSLTEQFTRREVKKKYLLLTDRPVPSGRFVVKTTLVRVGDRYLSRPLTSGADVAQTSFLESSRPTAQGGVRFVEAEPLTGRTHQIRVHAAEKGFPILGDTRYGGTPGPRLCLHATELSFRHPVSSTRLCFEAPPDFEADPGVSLRELLIDPQLTNAFRLIHGASDGYPGWYVEKLGAYLLSQSANLLTKPQLATLTRLSQAQRITGVYHKELSASVRQAGSEEGSPRLILGASAPERFAAAENGLRFEFSFQEGYSVGLFLDQRDNRRRLLTRHVAAGFPLFESAKAIPRVLNTFSYTCAFSVYAARAGAHTTSLDLSKKYLDWGRANFRLNQLDPQDHDFIFGDVFDWLHRLHKKGRIFELVLLDPPTFSRSKSGGVFRTEKDYGRLIRAALPLLAPRGVLFSSCNTATWPAESFLNTIRASINAVGRSVLQEHYFPQPPDFPISAREPAYLKTFWVRLN